MSKPVVIHRVIRWVEKGDRMWPESSMWPAGPAALWAGYITRGDNNYGLNYDTDDQMAPRICFMQPVKKDWIIGVAYPEAIKPT